MLTTLSANTERKESEILKQGNAFDEVEFPLQSYMYLIKDFFVRGYYKEQEVLYKVAKSGKINWNRTIKTQKPYVQDMDVFYLDFVTKKNSVKENELITLIHEYCVYESFERIGWLYTEMMPKKPVIVKQEGYSVLFLKIRLPIHLMIKTECYSGICLQLLILEEIKTLIKITDMEHIVLNIYGRK